MIDDNSFPLLDQMPSGIMAIDPDGTLVLWNRVMEQWSGLQRSEVIGHNIFEQFDNLNTDRFKIRIKQVLSSHTPIIFSAQLHHHIIPCPLPNGELRVHKATVTWLHKQKIALFSIEDQTEQHKLIEKYKLMTHDLQSELDQKIKLEKQNARLISAIDQAGEAIIIINRQGDIEYTNRAFHQQTGWDYHELNTSGFFNTLYNDDHEEDIPHHLRTVFSDGETWQGRQNITHKDGKVFAGSISIAPISGEGSGISHAVIIQEDISQQVSLDEKLRRSQKQEALITLVGGIAHDFNNLLAGLVGQAYLASREVKDMPKTAERLEKIKAITQDASEIVKQLLTFARQGDHEAKEFPLDAFFKEFYKLARLTVPESITMKLDYQQGNYAFRGDANQLQQSILNVVQNAVEACDKNHEGQIELAISLLHNDDDATSRRVIGKYPVLRHGNFAHITIKDNGPGILPGNLDKVFDPFYTTKQLGSGLGLAIVLGCIRSHHGIIDIESKADQGTTIHLFLPTKTPKSKGEESLNHDSIQANILLIDDDPNVLEPTKELLECMGHHVSLACDGVQASEVFESSIRDWDIVITDMVMPRMNGLEAAKLMRMLQPDIPIIFATGYDQSLVIDNTRQMDNAILISKPFNPDDLDQLIIEMVKKRGKKRA